MHACTHVFLSVYIDWWTFCKLIHLIYAGACQAHEAGEGACNFVNDEIQHGVVC